MVGATSLVIWIQANGIYTKMQTFQAMNWRDVGGGWQKPKASFRQEGRGWREKSLIKTNVQTSWSGLVLLCAKNINQLINDKTSLWILVLLIAELNLVFQYFFGNICLTSPAPCVVMSLLCIIQISKIFCAMVVGSSGSSTTWRWKLFSNIITLW